jgi:predicted metal-dependent hydrolase
MPPTEQRSITLQGRAIPYLLKETQRSTRIRISVSDVGVTLIIPSGYPIRDGENFLHRNADWVLQQLEKHQKRTAKTQRKTLPDDVLLLRGIPTQVVVIEEPARKLRPRVDEAGGKLIIRIPVGAAGVVPTGLEGYLRDLATARTRELVESFASRMGVRPKAITIRDQRTRWGSCSSSGTLSFNWRLIMVPPTIMEYVVIHELAHMIQPNHSDQFWAVVVQFYPAYKEARSWLRKNASLLHPKILTTL